MTKINQIAQLEYDRLFPNSDDDSRLTFDDFLQSVRIEYAMVAWRFSYEMRRAEGGEFELPGNLVKHAALNIEKGVVELSVISPLYGLPDDSWIRYFQPTSGCNDVFIKTTRNRAKAIDEGEIGSKFKRYYVDGERLKFVSTEMNEVECELEYICNDPDGESYVDDRMASLLRQRLREIYAETGKENKTADNNNEQ